MYPKGLKGIGFGCAKVGGTLVVRVVVRDGSSQTIVSSWRTVFLTGSLFGDRLARRGDGDGETGVNSDGTSGPSVTLVPCLSPWRTASELDRVCVALASKSMLKTSETVVGAMEVSCSSSW